MAVPDSTPHRVLFRCDGNAATGLGHLSRCVNLARYLQREAPATQNVFWGNYDDFSVSLLARYGLPTLSAPLPGNDNEGITLTRNVCAAFDVLLLDNYGIDQHYINGLKQQPFRLALIDDDQRHNLRGADLVICIRSGAEVLDYGARHQLLGPSFTLVKPELHPIRERNLALFPERPIKRILVFLSGGQLGMNILPTVLKALDTRGLEVSYLASRALLTSPPYARHIALTPGIEAIYAETDFVICGGGLTKYECAYAGISNACISLTTLQDEDTKIMATQGFTLDLGRAEDIKSSRLHDQIAEFINNPTKLVTQRQAFASKLNGDGPRQVAQMLLSL